MQNNPQVTVVIPAYNANETVAAAVKSALMQDVDLEVIVIDDCSKEDTMAALGDLLNDARVFFIKNETNLGVAKTRNRGVLEARGKYIAFLDSDDCWREGKLSKQLDLMSNTNVVISATAREIMDEAGNATGKIIPVPEEVTYKKLLHGNAINCSSVVVARDVALEFPMGDDDVHEDYLCWLSILKKHGKAALINEPLLLYRQTTTGKSGRKGKSAAMTYRTYRRHGLGIAKSAMCFVGYAVSAVRKYFL